MTQYDNNNRGAVWPARERRTDKSPHYTGKATIAGVEYDVSMWEGEGGNRPAFSFRVTPQSERTAKTGTGRPGNERRARDEREPRRAPVNDDDLNDPVPF